MPSQPTSQPGGLVWFDEPAPPRGGEQLSRERIVVAAIALADADVRGEVTMRAVAARVGSSTPMSLYRYVGSKDGLTDLMVDQVYGEITVPRGDWRTSLRGLGLSGWEAVQRHPWFARLAFSRPPLGPNALALYDAALAPLDGFDLGAAERMGAISTVLGHVFGSGLCASVPGCTATRTWPRPPGPIFSGSPRRGATRTSSAGRTTPAAWTPHLSPSSGSSSGCWTGSKGCSTDSPPKMNRVAPAHRLRQVCGRENGRRGQRAGAMFWFRWKRLSGS